MHHYLDYGRAMALGDRHQSYRCIFVHKSCSSLHGRKRIWHNYECIIRSRFVWKFWSNQLCSDKSGCDSYTQTWSKELGRKGINVNAVAPGFRTTEMVMAMPEAVLAKMSEKVPSNRLGKPEDIANIYAFLASDQADYINGATISVDGGITL